jgi:hypothetical protein
MLRWQLPGIQWLHGRWVGTRIVPEQPASSRCFSKLRDIGIVSYGVRSRAATKAIRAGEIA